jgi:hypothetical protein
LLGLVAGVVAETMEFLALVAAALGVSSLHLLVLLLALLIQLPLVLAVRH